MSFSVVIPVYNEAATLGSVLVAVSKALPEVAKEIVIVDDCSIDGTREWLRRNFPSDTRNCTSIEVNSASELEFSNGGGGPELNFRVIYHNANAGKGGALRTGFAKLTGDVVVIQDADLEYDPNDWGAMYDLIADRKIADVVYGSRFYGRPHRSLYYHHYLANRLISVLFNVLYNQALSDIETCYKMMRREVLQSLHLTSSDFGIEVELSARIAQQRSLRIYELGICYYGRTYQEGKKINWQDGLKALWYLLKFKL